MLGFFDFSLFKTLINYLYLWPADFQKGWQDHSVFQQMVLGKLSNNLQRLKLDLYLISYSKLQNKKKEKWVNDQNIRSKLIKLLKENRGTCL